MLGNTPTFCMAPVRVPPWLTSRWIILVASKYTTLPAAPATELSASTSGTPAANMVANVRVHRAIEALRITPPKIGSLSIILSMTSCIFLLRFQK